MKAKHAWALLIVSALLAGCSRAEKADESLAPGELAKWNDPNFDIISIGAYNYTDHDIYDVFLLPPDKSDIQFAARGSGGRALPRSATAWELDGASGPNLAWDRRWTMPKKFKVWWFRVVDKSAYAAAGNKYDKYTTKETRPGAAWCEGEIAVQRPPAPGKVSYLVLHYFPDGHVEGDIEYSGEVKTRVPIASRGDLPVLNGQGCLQEVPNPFYGKKKPTPMY